VEPLGSGEEGRTTVITTGSEAAIRVGLVRADLVRACKAREARRSSAIKREETDRIRRTDLEEQGSAGEMLVVRSKDRALAEEGPVVEVSEELASVAEASIGHSTSSQ